jgi:hypothetical protein
LPACRITYLICQNVCPGKKSPEEAAKAAIEKDALDKIVVEVRSRGPVRSSALTRLTRVDHV